VPRHLPGLLHWTFHETLRSFATQNPAFIRIIPSYRAANEGTRRGYGTDRYTETLVNQFSASTRRRYQASGVQRDRRQLSQPASLTKSYHAVICAASAHIYTTMWRSGKITGCKLIPIPLRRQADRREGTARRYTESVRTSRTAQSISSLNDREAPSTAEEIRGWQLAHERTCISFGRARIANAAGQAGPDSATVDPRIWGRRALFWRHQNGTWAERRSFSSGRS